SMLQRERLIWARVVAKTVNTRLKHRKRVNVSVLLRGIGSAGRERDRDLVAGLTCSFFNSGATAEHDQIRKRDLLSAGLGVIESTLDHGERFEHRCELGWLVHLPVLLRGKP